MAKCKFCQRRFQSEQGVKAHLKHCKRYQTIQSKKARALGTKPKATATPAATPLVQPSPPVAAQDVTAPLYDFVKAMSEAATKRDAPQTPQQQRRKILQAAKAQVVDQYRSSSGTATSPMRGGVKLAIEQELASLPLEEFPFEEVCDLVAAIRDQRYAPAFNRQRREADRLRVEEERRHHEELEAVGALVRAERRKKPLIQQASHQAQASCEEKEITGWEKLSVLGDIETRLDALLTGEEPVLEAQAIVRSVLDARFAEAEATLAAARAKADAQWYEGMAGLLVLGALLATPLLALNYPVHMLAILNWIERKYALTPEAEAAASTHDASEATPPAANTESRPPSTRRRKDPVAPPSPETPWEHSIGPEQGHA